jgi:type IV pilus assembly protein PilO
VATGLATARQLDTFRQVVGVLEARLDALRPILPEEKDVADLLRRIQTLATQSSLTIKGFKPEAITTRELHAEWPIGLELEGTYHSFGLFLDRVSKFPRIINIGAIAITPTSPPSPGASIQVSCTATTFVLLDASAAAAEPPATRGAKP